MESGNFVRIGSLVKLSGGEDPISHYKPDNPFLIILCVRPDGLLEAYPLDREYARITFLGGVGVFSDYELELVDY